MRAGRLREQIAFETKAKAEDSFGDEIEQWVPAFTIWGQCQRVGSREFPADQKRQSETTARFIVRYLEGITAASYRIKHAGKTWNLSDPIPDERHRMLTIEASEIT